MLTLNLESLGVSEETLKNAILNELGITKEEALSRLAKQLGVEVPSPTSSVISSGQTVQTDQGESVAQTLTPSEIATLREAAAIQSRIFG